MSIPLDHDNDPSMLPPSEEELLEALLHCSDPSMKEFPSAIRQIRHAGRLDSEYGESIEPRDDEGNQLTAFEYAEHVHLGNLLSLKWHDGATYLGKDKTLKLENGLEVIYDQMCALGEDFFRYGEPICLGKDSAEQAKRFELGYETLTRGAAGKP